MWRPRSCLLLLLQVACLLLLSGLVTSPVAAKKKKVGASRPNVVLFLMDDVGWQDVGWHEGSGMFTPTLDRLAHTGAVLDSYYVQPVCSPTRAALMQGRWPWRAGMGLQHFDTLSPGSMAAMNLTQPTMAEVLRGAGYRRHMVGKWHLGYHAWENTPTGRGFESHMGYYQGEMLYYNKTFSFTSVAPDYLPEWLIKDTTGLDWWRNRTAWRGTEKIYSKELYDAEAAEVLDNHPAGGPPLFLYFAHQCAHLPLDRYDFPLWLFFFSCTRPPSLTCPFFTQTPDTVVRALPAHSRRAEANVLCHDGRA
jgi:arylsulfatase B